MTEIKQDIDDSGASKYKPSFNTGIFGGYTYIDEATINDEASMPPYYQASMNTGIFGSYCYNINDMPDEYKPSLNTGTFGTYFYDKWYPSNYKPSLNTGTFGTYLYGLSNTDDVKIDKPSKETIIKYKTKKKYNVQILQHYKYDDINANLYICQGSVVNFSGDGIVNAANEGCQGGGGVDGAITRAGGRLLRKYRRELPSDNYGVRCPTGQAVITKSGKGAKDCDLECNYVIHSVGPSYGYSRDPNAHPGDDKLLSDAYKNTMILSHQNKIKSLGFCLISSGIFRGGRSLRAVLEIGIEAINETMYSKAEIYVIGFNRNEIDLLQDISPKIIGNPDIKYVDPRMKDNVSQPKKGFYNKIMSNIKFKWNNNKE
mmetsp:Transcript_40427/g.49874  ORF Transcript_40427/g.49874 Transcript_40427/m.49874 type:complete len:372 (+) Transcript_40427:46-1161(+)